MSADSFPGGGAAVLVRLDARARAAADDLLLADDLRLDDRVRATAAGMLRACVDAVEDDLRRLTARELAALRQTAAAETLLIPAGGAYDLLERTGLLRDAPLIEELLATARQEWLADRLAPDTSDPARVGLLTRLSECPDAGVATAAGALAAAQASARSILPLVRLPAELHHRLVWRVAAAIRTTAVPSPAFDRALVAAAGRSLVGHDEGDLPREAANRLAAAIDAQQGEVAPLLLDSLRDRSIPLFAAVLARAAAVDYGRARMLVLDPTEPLLWVAVRAAGVPRDGAATMAAALAGGDPARDLDELADALDRADALGPEELDDRLVPLRLPRDLGDAVLALEAGR